MLLFRDVTCDWSYIKKGGLIDNSSVVEQWLAVETKDDRRTNGGTPPLPQLQVQGFVIVTPSKV